MTSSELVRITPETKQRQLAEPEALQAVRHELINSVNDLVARLQRLINLETDCTTQQDFYLYRELFASSTFEVQLARVHTLAHVSYARYCGVFKLEHPDPALLEYREALIADWNERLATGQPVTASGRINHAVYVNNRWLKEQASQMAVALPTVGEQLVANGTELIDCLRALVDCDFSTRPLPQPVVRYEYVAAKVSHLAMIRILLSHLEQPHTEAHWADFKRRYFIGGLEPFEYVQYLQYYVDCFDKDLHYIATGELLK